jgi:hypothetical protein
MRPNIEICRKTLRAIVYSVRDGILAEVTLYMVRASAAPAARTLGGACLAAAAANGCPDAARVVLTFTHHVFLHIVAFIQP